MQEDWERSDTSDERHFSVSMLKPTGRRTLKNLWNLWISHTFCLRQNDRSIIKPSLNVTVEMALHPMPLQCPGLVKVNLDQRVIWFMRFMIDVCLLGLCWSDSNSCLPPNRLVNISHGWKSNSEFRFVRGSYGHHTANWSLSSALEDSPFSALRFSDLPFTPPLWDPLRAINSFKWGFLIWQGGSGRTTHGEKIGEANLDNLWGVRMPFPEASKCLVNDTTRRDRINGYSWYVCHRHFQALSFYSIAS